MDTYLDIAEVQKAVGSFPKGRDWQALYCKNLISEGRDTKSWVTQRGLEHEIGGNYVFLMPVRHFRRMRKIGLSGPSVKGSPRKIYFHFKPKTVTIDGKAWAVLYVGKSSKMRQRFQWHFSNTGKNSGGQVQNNLDECREPGDPKPALDWLLKEGLICFRELDGYEEAANREMIEVGLWAKFAPPFNIKSER